MVVTHTLKRDLVEQGPELDAITIPRCSEGDGNIIVLREI
jgi:hypothetical protein